MWYASACEGVCVWWGWGGAASCTSVTSVRRHMVATRRCRCLIFVSFFAFVQPPSQPPSHVHSPLPHVRSPNPCPPLFVHVPSYTSLAPPSTAFPTTARVRALALCIERCTHLFQEPGAHNIAHRIAFIIARGTTRRGGREKWVCGCDCSFPVQTIPTTNKHTTARFPTVFDLM